MAGKAATPSASPVVTGSRAAKCRSGRCSVLLLSNCWSHSIRLLNAVKKKKGQKGPNDSVELLSEAWPGYRRMQLYICIVLNLSCIYVQLNITPTDKTRTPETVLSQERSLRSPYLTNPEEIQPSQVSAIREL